MSKRDITLFFIGVVCSGIVVGIGMLTIRPLLTIHVVATESAPSQQPRGASSRSDTERLSYAFDGYCPVTLIEKWQWTLGDIHYREKRGTLVFLFAGSAEQKQFQKDPDRYLPAFSGNDVVIAKENSETTGGKREHGIKYDDRIYLFATEESLHRFAHDPMLYVTPNGDGPIDGDIKVAVNSDN
jgi:YHS domain-containing protein